MVKRAIHHHAKAGSVRDRIGFQPGCLPGANVGRGRRGAILIGLIVMMVIFSALGAAILPITSTSLFSQVAANNMTKAYYLAESGYRYAASQFISVSGETNRDNMIGTIHNKTYNLSNSAGSFHLESYPYYYKTAANTGTSLVTAVKGGWPAARTIPATGKLAIKDTSGASIAGSPFSYSSYTRNGSTMTFTLTATPSPAIASDQTVLPILQAGGSQTMTRGGNLVLGSGVDTFPVYRGTFRVGTDTTVYMFEKRVGSTLQNITKFNDSGSTFSVSVPNGQDVVLLKYIELRSTGSLGSGIMATSRLLTYYGPIAAINLDQGLAGGLDPAQAENVPSLETLAAASGSTSTGRFSTINLGGDTALNITQTTGGGNQPSTEAYVSLPSGPSNPIYLSWDGAGGYLSYDIQVKVATGDWNAGTGSFINKPDTYCTGIMFRAGTTLSNQSTFYGVSYMRSNNSGGNSKDGVPDSMIPPPTSTTNNKAMLVLWTRNGNQGNGDDNWLAYELLDQTGGTDYVVDNAGHLKDWSTVLVRVVEAASFKLAVSTAPNVNIGDTVTGGSGTAIVFRKINDSDGNVVLLLNNIVGAFTRPATVSGYSTDAAWGYRSRDNYVWVFYTDTGAHSSDTTPLNNVRLGQDRATINWPITDVQSWAAADDKFSLVQWGAGLNTAQDATLRIMGSGKDANGIIRTAKWTTGAYTAGSFPPEIGVVSMGASSVDTYFDDLSFYLRGGVSSGGGTDTGFLPPIQQ